MNTPAKVLKQLGECGQPALSAVSPVQPDLTRPFGCVPAGVLGLGEWRFYCRALETFLRQIATHSILSKNKAVEIFLTNSEVSGKKKKTSFDLVLKTLFL